MQTFDLIVPDGMPLIWAMNRQCLPQERLTDRVYGPSLMLRTIEESNDRPEFRHFLLGGKNETLEKLKSRFARDYPSAKIVGTHSPPFGPWPTDEFARIRKKIIESKANLIWVGLGCPKQENWIAEHQKDLPNGVYFGIGAAFAFHAGEVAQAPEWFQKRGLEWTYRLACEPRRLFKRYVIYNSLFIWYLLCDRVLGNHKSQ